MSIFISGFFVGSAVTCMVIDSLIRRNHNSE